MLQDVTILATATRVVYDRGMRGRDRPLVPRKPKTMVANLTASLAQAWEAAVDARDDARFALFDAGVPAFLLTDLADLAGLLGRTEYALKTRVWEAPIWVLQETGQACYDWLDD